MSFILLGLSVFLLNAVVFAANSDPIVLVHGLGGTIESFEYIQELEQSGLKTIAVEVNPFASNYDRAAELYAQLKGVRVDYGFCHTQENEGHVQFGEDFTGKGLYPQWDSNHRLHFIGHSMGGTTIRSLERLLELGSGCSRDTSKLFQGGNKWITSVSTLASPMDGTTVFDHIPGGDVFLLEQFIGLGSFESGELDFPMWGLEQGEDESFDEYWQRVVDFGLLRKKDFSVYNLRVKGSEEFNSEGPQVFPGTYYFSYASERTYPERKCDRAGMLRDCETVETPEDEMSFILKFSGRLIGSNAEGNDRINDGIVNQYNARCPSDKNCKDVKDEIGTWTPGQWHVVMLDFLDHFQITDRDDRNDKNNFKKSAKRIYLEHGVRLQQLNSGSSRLELDAEEEFAISESSARTKRYIDAMKFFTEELEAQIPSNDRVPPAQLFAVVAMVALAAVGIVMVAWKGRKGIKKETGVDQALETTL